MLDGEWHVDTVHLVKVHHPSGRAFATGHNDFGPFITCGTLDLDGGESSPPPTTVTPWLSQRLGPRQLHFRKLLVLQYIQITVTTTDTVRPACCQSERVDLGPVCLLGLRLQSPR